jgi:hypothetical protein
VIISQAVLQQCNKPWLLHITSDAFCSSCLPPALAAALCNTVQRSYV